MITWEEFELIALRLTFGGSPNPSRWSDLSELVCDLGNDMVRSSWDPKKFHSPHEAKLPEEPKFLPDDVPFAPAKPMAIPDFEDTEPRADIFIDDLINGFLEQDLEKGRAILPYLLHLVGRPVHPDEPLPRDDLLSLKKFLAEATPAEKQIVLGWLLDTRRLRLSLPPDKATAWRASISNIIKANKTTYAALDTLIGRLNHVAYVVPGGRHFLGRLRSLKRKAASRGGRPIKLPPYIVEDLKLWLLLLHRAEDGLSLNLLTARKPDRRHRSDACPAGIGGYNLITGRAWRWQIPKRLRGRATLNSLEFLASYICVAVDLLEGDIPPESVFLCETDSSTGEAWMHKSNFDDEDPFQMTVARALATLLLLNNCKLHGCWFPGDDNVSDCLSRDFHLTDKPLTNLLLLHVPEQLPEGFNISPLPRRIVSEMISWLEQLPPPTAPLEVHSRSKHATGACTCVTSNELTSTTTPSCSPCLTGNESGSASPLPMPTARGTSKPKVRGALIKECSQDLWTPPYRMFRRPLGTTTLKVRGMTDSETSIRFYQDSSKDTEEQTQPPSNKRRPRHT